MKNSLSLLLVLSTFLACAKKNPELTVPQVESEEMAIARAVQAGESELLVFESSAQDIHQNRELILKAAEKIIEKIVNIKNDERTFENTVAPLDQIESIVGTMEGRHYLLKDTSPLKEVRDAAMESFLKVEDWLVEFKHHRGIYEAVNVVAKTNHGLQGEDLRFLENVLKGFELSGFHLPQDQQDQIKVLEKEIEEIKAKISVNLKESDAKTVMLLSEEQVKEVPAKELKQLNKNEEGKFIIRPSISSEMGMIFKYVKDETIRRELYVMRSSRAQDTNPPLIIDLLKKRLEMAKLLGYDNWAAYRMQTKMAQTPERASTFLTELETGLEVKFRDELKTLAQIKAKELGLPQAEIMPWDMTRYIRLYEESTVQLDLTAFKKYFEYSRVLQGLFKVYETTFHINIKKIPAPSVWEKEVELLQISDKDSGEVKGYIYLDMFPRPETNKKGHFANFSVRQGKRLADGTYLKPVATLVCNFPRAKPDQPSLLSFGEVKTMFHEFGHSLHVVLTQSKFATFAGSAVPRDFVEAPSQMLENWVTDHKVLSLFAVNYEDESDRLPADFLVKVKQADRATKAIFYRGQLTYGLMDLALYSQKEIAADFDLTKFTNAFFARVFLPVPAETAFINSFSHITSGGYDAGYYGYAWADAISSDLASLFENSPEGFLDPVLGMKLRREIYERGDSRDINESIEAFLGRKPNRDAFLRKLGIGQ